MKNIGTISVAYSVLASLIRGAVHDRKTIADAFGMTVASADRYIRELIKLPGVVLRKKGRRLTVRWYLTKAIEAAGL
jgi:hypothetical protein